MSFSTKEELAALLHGREYRNEISAEEEVAAKAAGLVVVFGASDDLAEISGAISDEAGCGGESDQIIMDAKGEIPSFYVAKDDWRTQADAMDWFERKKKSFILDARWGHGGYSHHFGVSLPYAAFDIMDDNEKYCRGIVFELPVTGK